MSESCPAAYLFDLDGTLLDTAGDLAATVNRVLLQHGRPPKPLSALKPYVSQGLLKLISIGFDVPEDGEEALALRHTCVEIYRANLSIHTRLFDGMDKVLAKLESRKTPWGIVTNKPEGMTVPLLEELDLRRRAACIVGADTASASKPSPAPVLYGCDRIGVSPAETVMIGDDRRDIIAGAAAGTMTIAVGWGYLQPNDEPALWSADHVLATVDDLDEWIG